MIGLNFLLNHIKSHSNEIEIARIKHGFLDSNKSGYRDIKLNVVLFINT